MRYRCTDSEMPEETTTLQYVMEITSSILKSAQYYHRQFQGIHTYCNLKINEYSFT